MGLYLYGCYTPKKNVEVVLPDGIKAVACMYRYITKPYWDNWNGDIVSLGEEEWGYGGRMTMMKVAKILKLWEEYGERPRFALHVSDSYELKQEGLRRPVTGSLSFHSKGLPPVWIEELYGEIGMGECERHGSLWTMKDWHFPSCKEDYEKAREALTQSEMRAILKTGQDGISQEVNHATVVQRQ